LNEVQLKYGARGLVVLGFPCNQFGLQENSDNSEILPTIKYVRPGGGFEPNFQLFEKIKVNGDDAHELFQFLRKSLPNTPPTNNNWVIDTRPNYLTITPCKPGELQWNFEKFLVDNNGTPVRRLSAKSQIEEIETALVPLLEVIPK